MIAPEAEPARPSAGSQAAAVNEAVRARRAEMYEFLAELTRIETPTLEPATQMPALRMLREGLESAGLRSRIFAGRQFGGMLLGRSRGRGGPSQLLLGHCDTVWPVGTLESMPVVIEGPRMRGPGIYDMKAGLTQMVYALRALRDVGLAPSVQPVVLVNSDEEVGSRDSYRYIDWLARVVERVYVMEPSLTPAGLLKTARKGLAQYRIRVKGRAAHAGLNPEEGISAILELSVIVQRLFELNDLERGISVNVGTIDGGMRPNVIAPESQALVDVRVPTRADWLRTDAAIRAIEPSRPGLEVHVKGVEGRPPMEFSPGGRRLWEAAQRIAGQLGFPIDHGRAGGGSDGNITNQHAPTLDGLGAVGDGAHAAHEHVDLERMLERTALLAMLIMEPAQGQGSG